VVIDVCLPCQSFWFDAHESVQLSPGGTLALFRLIGEHTGKRSIRRQMSHHAAGMRRAANTALSRTAAPTPTPASARLETARVMLR